MSKIQYVLSLSPPIVFYCYHPVHPQAQISDTDVRADGLIINFAMYWGNTMQD